MNDRADSRGRARRSARRRRRFVTVAVIAGALAAVAFAVALAAPSDQPQTQARATTTVRRTPTTTSQATSTTTSTSTTTTTDPGALPQTDQFPASNTLQFASAMQALWNGVVGGSVQPALTAFFPRSAYVQLKTGIYDPIGDWTNRLLADYALDIQAAHALIASDPAAASFVGVSVPQQYGHWIEPGVCANGIGYYEVANSRLVYQFQGQTRSFGIASMISWRGEWYVVHLGAILRPSTAGIVDDPEAGAGASAPSSTC
jgi:hypothetical protein